MIRPSELRIGNYVETPYDKYSSIRMVNSGYISDRNNDMVSLSDCEPIPLTEEWLERFDIHKDYIFDNEYKRDIDGYLLYIEDIASCNVVNWDKPIKYVHEAQNLYFALTGNELEIKK